MILTCQDEKCPCKNMTISQLDIFVKNHKDQLLQMLNAEHKEKENALIEQLKQQNEKQKIEMEKLKECIEIKDKMQQGTHSLYKGDFGEKKLEILLFELFGERYNLNTDTVNKKMDIRMTHKTHNFTIGVESKEKKKLTATDISKFHKDKRSNNFMGGIFISTQAPIKEYVSKIDNCICKKNELYIYSNNTSFIGIVIECYLQKIEEIFLKPNSEDIQKKFQDLADYVLELYTEWNTIKKGLLNIDVKIKKMMLARGIPEKILDTQTKGHVFLVTKSKCKANKNPY